MKALRKYIELLLAAVLVQACQRDHLYYGSEDLAFIYLDIDWDKAGLDPNGASVYAYTPDGNLYRHFPPFSNADGGYVALPEGHYNLVIFNNTPDEYEGALTFSDAENWSTFKATSDIDMKATNYHRAAKAAAASRVGGTATKSEKATLSRADDTFTGEPDTLAVGRILNYHVTHEMTHRYYYDPESAAEYERSAVVGVAPERVMSLLKVQIHIKGLKYAKGPISAYIRGLARGYYLGTGQNSYEQCTHQFYLNNRKFDAGSSTDGTVYAQFNTFGMVPQREFADSVKYYLDCDIVLTNGEEYPVSFDVTNDIKIDLEAQIELNMNLKLDLEIELPEPIGGDDDDPSGDHGGGGFRTDVSDWDEEEIDMPM